MSSPENLLLYLPEEQEQQVKELFEALANRGFPRQFQTPHITVTFAQRMDEGVVKRAQELLPNVIPAEFTRVGMVVFGTKRKQTVTWLLETTDELEEVARELSALNPEGRGNRWTPHLTMGLRLPRDIVPDYVRALDEVTAPRTFTAERAGYWRPATQELTVLAGSS